MYISKKRLALSIAIISFLLPSNILYGLWAGADTIYPIDYSSPSKTNTANEKFIKAAKLGDIKLAKKALQEGAGFHFKDKEHKRTALDWAKYYQHEDLTHFLIKYQREQANEQHNIPAYYLHSPLFTTLYYNSTPHLAALLENGANLQTSVGHKDSPQTPAHYAAFFGRVGCLRLLLDHGADVSQRDSQANTVLHAALKGATQETDQTHKSLPIIETLLRAGARAAVVNQDEQTPLDLARSTKNTQIIALIEKAFNTQKDNPEQVAENRALRATHAYQDNLLAHIVSPACRKHKLIGSEDTVYALRASNAGSIDTELSINGDSISFAYSPSTTSQYSQAFDFTHKVVEDRKGKGHLQPSNVALPAMTAATTTALYQLARLAQRAPVSGRARLLSTITGGLFGILAQERYREEINNLHSDYLAARALPYRDEKRNGFVGGREYYQEQKFVTGPSNTLRARFLQAGQFVHTLFSFGASPR